MKTIQLILGAAITLLSCCAPPDGPNAQQQAEIDLWSGYVSYFERIDSMRANGASREMWERDITLEKPIESIRELEMMISPWGVPEPVMQQYRTHFRESEFCGFYYTERDGRMLIFFDAGEQSFDAWASWDDSNRPE